MKLSQKRFLIGNFITQDQLENQQKKWEDVIQRETSQILGIKGWRRTARTQSRMEVSTEGGQGTAGVGRATDGWIARTSFQMPCTSIFRRRAMQ